MKKRLMSLLLAIFLVLGLVPVWNVEVQAASYPAAFPTPELTGDQAADVVAIAESQVGYKATSTDETVYAVEIGASNPNYWCAYFVKWCMNKAGVTDYLSVNGGAGSSTLLMLYFKKMVHGMEILIRVGQTNVDQERIRKMKAIHLNQGMW